MKLLNGAYRTIISACLVALVTVTPAINAVASTRGSGLDTSGVPCSANSVWLKLWGSTGEHCYTGTGSVIVYLPGVDLLQVVGNHSGSLSNGSGRIISFSGPRTEGIDPPITVREITLRC
jgi:hypothetical protein